MKGASLVIGCLEGQSMWKKIRGLVRKRPKIADAYRDPNSGLCVEEYFRMTLHLEEMRSERSGKPFLLMRLHIGELDDPVVREVATVVLSLTREVDLNGWWRTGREIAILFTEVNAQRRGEFMAAEKVITDKIKKGLRRRLGITTADRIRISCTLLPESKESVAQR